MLPAPIDGTQEYLKAIHDRLGELLDRLPPAGPAARTNGTVELREPAVPVLSAPESPPTAAPSRTVRPARARKSPAKRTTSMKEA